MGVQTLTRDSLPTVVPVKFRVRRNAAFTSTNASFVLVTYDTKDFDTGSNIDVTTNKGRFTAPVAGFYVFFARASFTGLGNSAQVILALYKNGSVYQRGLHEQSQVSGAGGSSYGDLVQLAAGDYVEMYVYTDGNASLETAAGSQAFFSGWHMSY